jgi:hypothetical protein
MMFVSLFLLRPSDYQSSNRLRKVSKYQGKKRILLNKHRSNDRRIRSALMFDRRGPDLCSESAQAGRSPALPVPASISRPHALQSRLGGYQGCASDPSYSHWASGAAGTHRAATPALFCARVARLPRAARASPWARPRSVTHSRAVSLAPSSSTWLPGTTAARPRRLTARQERK